MKPEKEDDRKWLDGKIKEMIEKRLEDVRTTTLFTEKNIKEKENVRRKDTLLYFKKSQGKS